MNSAALVRPKQRNQFSDIPAEDRFWGRVNKTDTCWLWTGVVSRKYGQFWFENRHVLAHRFSYEILRPIPDGLQLDHLCRTPLCVRPDHLEAVSSAENTRRGSSPSAINAKKTHCPKGHPYSGPNLLIFKYKKTARGCRACRNEYSRAYSKRIGSGVRKQILALRETEGGAKP